MVLHSVTILPVVYSLVHLNYFDEIERAAEAQAIGGLP
jgi:hypothetical protein